jgi:hypothetical protein
VIKARYIYKQQEQFRELFGRVLVRKQTPHIYCGTDSSYYIFIDLVNGEMELESISFNKGKAIKKAQEIAISRNLAFNKGYDVTTLTMRL